MTTVTVTTVGSSTGIVLPREIRDYMGLEKGDTVAFIKEKDGVRMVRRSAEFDKWMAIGHDIMERYSDTLRKLAE